MQDFESQHGGQSDTNVGEKLAYRVECNAGKFVVRAENQSWISFVLIEGMKTPMTGVNHGREEGAGLTMKEVLGIPDIDDTTITAELVVGKMATHYAEIDLPDVVYMGSPTPQR